mmetsp:Transcript_9477/g.27698  ORF Transcript_9477/g.27698 Transcript_9477/m.27698 type:complete len:240 (-) Transcript_9477:225-944(-)
MDFGSTPPAGIAAQQELENLRRVFVAMDVDCDGQISESDISRTLRTFSYTPRKGEVADMIWEVDEDADRHVSWAEFELMFMRCRSDKTGLEPRKLFDVVEFMMHDKDGSGKVSFDECMEILYRRFGKEMLEERTNDFFKADLNGDNEIDFAEFQKQMTSGVRPGIGGASGSGYRKGCTGCGYGSRPSNGGSANSARGRLSGPSGSTGSPSGSRPPGQRARSPPMLSASSPRDSSYARPR